jgi:ABC-2 type transport system ATP-binding protein
MAAAAGRLATLVAGRHIAGSESPAARTKAPNEGEHHEVISLESVTKQFGATRRSRLTRPAALQDVTLTLERGLVHAVVGPNGAGKSTLFGLALGFLHPTAGIVEIDGMEPDDFTARHGAAYLPERFSLPPEWPVGDALRYLAGLERQGNADAAAARVLAAMGLEPYADRRFGQLSRGLMQRVGIAQALLPERELVVLDEPTEGLDPLWRIRLRDEIGRLRAEGRTVLIASHDLAEVERLADRIIVLGGGVVREVLEVGALDAARSWVLRIERGADALDSCFPGFQPLDTDAEYLVQAADAAEVSGRLAAFLAAGGIVGALRPADLDLERRVRQLEGGE